MGCQIRRINCLLIKTKVLGTLVRLKQFRLELNETQDKFLIRICLYVVIVVQCSYVHLTVSKLGKRNHLLWKLCFKSVRGKNPTLIASLPKRMGCVVSVSSNFKPKFVSKRSKNDSKKNVVEFLRPESSAVFKMNFFPQRFS